jgi:TolA-binding protein
MNGWTAAATPTVPIFWPALQQVVGRARELAQQALSAEAEASARAMLRIKELQDQVTQSTREIDRLGQELEEKEDAREREHAQAEVRRLTFLLRCRYEN